jgi:putative peptidoglycan lipid II flippase
MAFFRSVATVGIFTLLSRVLGFVRDLVTAILLGAGPVADAFVFAQRLPQIFRGLLAEGPVSSTFMPLYGRKLHLEGKTAARKFAREIFTFFLIFLLIFTGLCLLFISEVVSLFAPGFVQDPERFRLAVTYGAITFGYLVLVSLVALQGGVLNSHGRFAPFSISPLILNVVAIAALTGAAFFKKDIGLIGSWALIAGGGLQFIFLWVSCRKQGVTLLPVWPRFSKGVRQFFRQVGPAVLGASAQNFNGMISNIFASGLSAGVVSALYYADRLLQLPVDVIGVAIATALLPVLTRHIATKEKEQAIHYFSRAVEFSMALSLPAFLFLFLEAEPVVRLLFQYGAFTPEDTHITAMCLASYATLVPGSVLMNVFMSCCYASGDTRAPIIAGFVCLAANVVLAFIFTPMWAHVGVALAATVSVWIGTGVLGLYLARKAFFRLDKTARQRLLRLIIPGLVMGLILWGENSLNMDGLVAFLPEGPLQNGGLLLIKAIVALGVYGFAVHFTGAMRLEEVRKLLRKKPAAPPESGA